MKDKISRRAFFKICAAMIVPLGTLKIPEKTNVTASFDYADKGRVSYIQWFVEKDGTVVVFDEFHGRSFEAHKFLDENS